MSETTKIEWTDATFNPWVGCTKVGPGCDNCYAETLVAQRYKRAQWGAGQPRSRTSAAYWRQPLRWNAEPYYECRACGARGTARFMIGEHNKCCPTREVVPSRRRVFCASLADVFDNEVAPEWRADLFELIERTPNLDWLLLTKRVGNVERLTPICWPANAWLGITVVNQEEADRDVPKLLQLRRDAGIPVAFLSCEPLLGPIDLDRAHQAPVRLPRVDWVIVGGESGHGARPMHPDWARGIRDQCLLAGVPFLFKQWGEWARSEDCGVANYKVTKKRFAYDVETFRPDGTRYSSVAAPHARDGYLAPGMTSMIRVGKKAAGRVIDGKTWTQFPRSST